MRPRLTLLATLGTLALVGASCGFGSSGVARTEKFEYPDIKNDFCGVGIDYRYCKCAFHKEMCDQIGMSKSEADKYVNAQYDEWAGTQLKQWGDSCAGANGVFNHDKAKCSYCEDGFEAQGQDCVKKESGEPDTKSQEASSADDILGPDCQVAAGTYDQNWKKYSDIDVVIPYGDRSYEAKQVYDFEERRIALLAEAVALKREQELDRLMLAELDRYHTALLQNIKSNLLKSFWRLAWVTYSTIDSGRGLGENYSELLEGVDIAAEGVGKGLKLIQGVVPNDSALTIDTNSVSGKVKSVSLNTGLEALASLGDPVATATEFFNSSANVNFPSADITDEEVQILKDQHIKKGKIDLAISENGARAAMRTARLASIEAEVAGLDRQIAGWEQKEKDRTRVEIEESCKKSKN